MDTQINSEYTVATGQKELSFESRQAAVEAAKDISTETKHREVVVTDDDGKLHMAYRDGALQYYAVKSRR